MTPKEKAEELFNKFNEPDRTNYPYIHNAQQCAIIAVDEILKTNPYKARNYWHEVKTEIEKL